MNFANEVMAGRFDPVDLAAVAVANSIWMPVHTGLSGILAALTPIVAQLLGAGRREEIPEAVRQAQYLSVAVALAVAAAGALALPRVFGAMALEESVRRIAVGYLGAAGLSVVPAYSS